MSEEFAVGSGPSTSLEPGEAAPAASGVGASVERAVVVMDEAGQIVAWDDAAADLTGWSAAEVVGRPSAWLHAADEGSEPVDLAEVRRHPVHRRSWRRRKDGTRFWCEQMTCVIRGAGGAAAGFVEVFGARTPSDQWGSSLGAEFGNAASPEHRSVVVFEQDAELRYRYLSGNTDVLGLPEDGGLIGHADDQLLVSAAGVSLIEAKREVLATATPATIEHLFGGGKRSADVILLPVVDDRGHAIGLRGLAVDTTVAHIANERLRNSYRRLAAAELVAGMGSWEYDIASDHAEWSDGAYALLGRKPGELADRLAATPTHVHPDDRARRSAAMQRALETGESCELDYRVIRGDGRIRFCHIRIDVIVDEAGKPAKLVGIFRDVTEANESVRSLQSAADELARRAAQLRDGLRVPREANGARKVEPTRDLSGRQREILALVAQGRSNVEIADALYLSENTVKWHIGKILRVLHVANRAQAIALFLTAEDA